MAKYLPENEISGALIALTTRIKHELRRLGYEVTQHRRGTYIVRRIGDENGG